jgi:hypothetical protein
MPRFSGPQFPQSQDSGANASQTITLAAPVAPVGQQSASVYYIVTSLSVFISGAAATADISITLNSGSRLMWKGWIGSGAARGASVPLTIPIDGWPAEAGQAVTLVVGAGGAGVVTTANISWTYG